MNQPAPAHPTVGDVGEHAVIREITSAAPSSRNGDDAAVLLPSAPNSRVVATTDMLVEGRHFNRAWSTPEEVGIKAVTANFADIEAMGARPISALLGLSLPADTPLSFVRGLAAGIHEQVQKYSAELIGGDITGGSSLVISVTAIGSLGGNLPELSLHRAKPGQRLVVHGRLGYSAAGLALLKRYGRDGVPHRFAELVSAHCAPQLTPGRGVIARATGATCMTDNSDGLVVDLSTIARRSSVGIDVSAEAIAPDSLLVDAGRELGVDPWQWVLGGGEDHSLLATTVHDAPSGFRTIGRTVRGSGVTIDGAAPSYNSGWVSF
ncbi:thiamine-phosphate kinase [Corynebacterium uterequi]|uniref:Thiamine-monophosphate kinase n=1 Tax=Corynebacterium uterequi TaxID=1072256 RepID=A0A0G3HE18_9CORY|nr:thiamine-phosphate kinase [Corynebacterium uterequi]AKK10975.1 thiamine-phosphate kinase [Corynebacterium uterequi]